MPVLPVCLMTDGVNNVPDDAHENVRCTGTISVVYNGICAKDGTDYYHTRSMVGFLRELTNEFTCVRYYGGYLEAHDSGYRFAREVPLVMPNLELSLARGNSTNTGTVVLVRN